MKWKDYALITLSAASLAGIWAIRKTSRERSRINRLLRGRLGL